MPVERRRERYMGQRRCAHTPCRASRVCGAVAGARDPSARDAAERAICVYVYTACDTINESRNSKLVTGCCLCPPQTNHALTPRTRRATVPSAVPRRSSRRCAPSLGESHSRCLYVLYATCAAGTQRASEGHCEGARSRFVAERATQAEAQQTAIYSKLRSDAESQSVCVVSVQLSNTPLPLPSL